MKKNKEKKSGEEQTLELLGKEMKTKYPPGSYIVFNGSYNKGEKPGNVSCGWYNKVGGKKREEKNFVSKPPEWQNIPYEKALEIAEMFSDHMITFYVYYGPPNGTYDTSLPKSY